MSFLYAMCNEEDCELFKSCSVKNTQLSRKSQDEYYDTCMIAMENGSPINCDEDGNDLDELSETEKQEY